MASVWFKKAGELLGTSDLDLGAAGDDIRALIVTDAYTLDYENHEFVSDVVASEVSGSTRLTLTGKTFTFNAAQKRWEFKYAAGNFGSPAAGPTIGAVIVYKFVTNDGLSPLLVFDDVADKPTTGDQVDYTPPTDGHQLFHFGA